MKNILTLLILFSFIIMNAQNNFGTLYFKDGSQKMGFISVTKSNKILFKKETHNEPIEYGFEDVTGFNDNDEYKYIIYEDKPIILKVVTEGKINLYIDSYFEYGPGNWSNDFYVAGGGEVTDYYIQHKYGIAVTRNKLQKKNDHIFNDCPLILEKLKKRKLKRRKLVEIIEFYNENCN